MPTTSSSAAEILSSLPPEWPDDPLPAIRKAISRSGRRIVVLDDDPTGTQTVHDVPILTEWGIDLLATELSQPATVFYLLTNSRSISTTAARELSFRVGHNLRQARDLTRQNFVVISRSDSTLRGHYEAELEGLSAGLEHHFDASIVAPFFAEGGRFTIGDIHYVREGDRIIPVSETEFAKDPFFGYRSSNLRYWIEEKTRGTIRADEVYSVSVEEIRQGGPEHVTARLMSIPRGGICVVNAASMRDIQVFALGMIEAENRGRSFLSRTAASFVQARAGIEPRSLLRREEIVTEPACGGLVVVGSFVPKTTSQLDHLLANAPITPIEVSIERLLGVGAEAEVERAARTAAACLARSSNAAIFTTRKLAEGNTAEQSLAIGQRISRALVAIVRSIEVRPGYLIAKGGITSSDIATLALGVKRAIVIGQVYPGVPVWRLGPETPFPDLPYIVFPGNVGESSALTEVLRNLQGKV